MVKATLVLEGGANRGVFTSGVLDYLMEKTCICQCDRRIGREETARRTDVPTETRETVITDETITVAMTDRDVNSETETTTEEMTERTTQAFRLLQSKDRNHRERMPREKMITRRKIIVVMMKKECQRARRKTSQNSSFRNHSRKSRR